MKLKFSHYSTIGGTHTVQSCVIVRMLLVVFNLSVSVTFRRLWRYLLL
jgi:hypothetical protein